MGRTRLARCRGALTGRATFLAVSFFPLAARGSRPGGCFRLKGPWKAAILSVP